MKRAFNIHKKVLLAGMINLFVLVGLMFYIAGDISYILHPSSIAQHSADSAGKLPVIAANEDNADEEINAINLSVDVYFCILGFGFQFPLNNELLKSTLQTKVLIKKYRLIDFRTLRI